GEEREDTKASIKQCVEGVESSLTAFRREGNSMVDEVLREEEGRLNRLSQVLKQIHAAGKEATVTLTLTEKASDPHRAAEAIDGRKDIQDFINEVAHQSLSQGTSGQPLKVQDSAGMGVMG
ncbi:unnamed protein product, partial [Discosporangium mesarthrocarpum]